MIVLIDKYLDPFEFKEDPIKYRVTQKYFYPTTERRILAIFEMLENEVDLKDSWLGNEIGVLSTSYYQYEQTVF